WGGVSQTLFKGSLNKTGTEPGKSPGYLAMNAIVRRAARILSERTGDVWTPAEVQETIWSWAKALYETASSKKSAEQILRDGELTDALINATPDFGSLLNEDQSYADILRGGGYGEQVSRLGGESPVALAASQPGTAGQKAPFAQRTQDRLLSQAAKRLDQRRVDLATEPFKSTALANSESDATYDDFRESPEDALRKPGWAIVTATRESKGDHTAPANITANNLLRKFLAQKGIEFEEVQGKWNGVDQGPSFLVFTDEKSALNLARKYHQDAVATSRGFVYVDGRFDAADHERDVAGPEARKRNGYTILPDGTPISIGFPEDKTAAQAAVSFGGRESVVAGTKLKGDGRGFTEFFSEASKGNRAPDKTVKYRPVLDISRLKSFSAEYVKHRGNFDDHIATSIPGFREVQQAVGNAVVESYPAGARVLDLGASEGAWGKAVTAQSGGKIVTTSLDPNLTMAEHFNTHSSVPGATYDISAFSEKADEGKTLWDENGTPIKGFVPAKGGYDVVHE